MYIETVQQIGDGMHAVIYLAERSVVSSCGQILDKQEICVKVFKPYSDCDSRKFAEEEYKVSQILKGNRNIININTFEREKPICINGQIEIKDFLTLDYCENSDLFSFLKGYSQR